MKRERAPPCRISSANVTRRLPRGIWTPRSPPSSSVKSRASSPSSAANSAPQFKLIPSLLTSKGEGHSLFLRHPLVHSTGDPPRHLARRQRRLFVRYTGAPDVTYCLQRAASLPSPWSDLTTNTVPASGHIEVQKPLHSPREPFIVRSNRDLYQAKARVGFRPSPFH